MATIDQLRQGVSSIIRDAEHKLASLAPGEPDILASIIRARWPDTDEVVDQVRGECAWIISNADTQEDQNGS